jgi:hypothetical protein
MNDEQGTGKPCMNCEWPTVALSSHNRRECVVCKRPEPWKLAEGQKPLINTSRGDKKK